MYKYKIVKRLNINYFNFLKFIKLRKEKKKGE